MNLLPRTTIPDSGETPARLLAVVGRSPNKSGSHVPPVWTRNQIRAEPHTGMNAPFTTLDSSLAKKLITSAISSGWGQLT